MNRMVIVDDDRHLLDSLQAVFADAYEIRTAPSAEAALKLLAREPADVLLLDVKLPGRDGVAFLRELREKQVDLPVVMISGAVSIRPVIGAMALGACDYIRKPFDVEELRLVVERALENAALRRRLRTLEKTGDSTAVRPPKKPLKAAVEEYERRLIEEALRRNDGIQTRAAEMLGTTRRILRYRIQKLNIDAGDQPV